MPAPTRTDSPPPPYAGGPEEQQPQQQQPPPAPMPPVTQAQTQAQAQAPAPTGFFQRLAGGLPGIIGGPTPVGFPVGISVGFPVAAPSAAPAAAPVAVEVPMGLPRDESRTLLAMVVDRSGSMASMGSELEGGCNAYLEKQRAEDEADSTATDVIFTRFDNVVETVFKGSLAEMGTVTRDMVMPRGSTALYDAIGAAIAEVAAELNANHRKSTPHVAMFILTDGFENASQRWNKARIAEEIGRLKGPGIEWEFFFAAANQDALQEGSKLGMSPDNCMSWNARAGAGNITTSMEMVQEAHSRAKKGMRRAWTKEERMSCMS